MLSREDSRRLAELERQLRRDDPEFCARMEGGRLDVPVRRRRFPLSLILTATVVWIAAVTLGVLGWWVSAISAAALASLVVAAIIIRAHRYRATS